MLLKAGRRLRHLQLISTSSASSTPTPEEAASEAASSSNTPTPEEMASGASTGATPTAAPSSSKQLANLLKQVRDEIRSLKGTREIDGTVEFDPNSGLIRFVDGRIDLAETQKFEDFNA